MMEMVMVTYSWGSTPARQRATGGCDGHPHHYLEGSSARGGSPAEALMKFAEEAAPAETGGAGERGQGVKEAKSRFTFSSGPKQEGPQGGWGLTQVEPRIVQERVGVGLCCRHPVW